MDLLKNPKLYLAGPEIFLPNAVENALKQKALCEKYGFIGLHPVDNNLDLSGEPRGVAMRIYRGNVGQIKECNIVVANCNPFRGALMDDGTTYELGYGNALGKPSYGYIRNPQTYKVRVQNRYAYRELQNGRLIDVDGYLLLDDFGTWVNLMMQCGMGAHGGELVRGEFEDCLEKIRFDLKTGSLLL